MSLQNSNNSYKLNMKPSCHSRVMINGSPKAHKKLTGPWAKIQIRASGFTHRRRSGRRYFSSINRRNGGSSPPPTPLHDAHPQGRRVSSSVAAPFQAFCFVQIGSLLACYVVGCWFYLLRLLQFVFVLDFFFVLNGSWDLL